MQHSVPYSPYEEAIKVQNPTPGVMACEDSENSVDPTCIQGWGGFCCNKNVDQLQDPDLSFRGEELFGASTFSNSFSTGHCLREGELIFTGYSIDSRIQDSRVHVQVSQQGALEFEFDYEVTLVNGKMSSDAMGYAGSFPNLEEYLSYTSDLETLAEEGNMLYIPTSPSLHAYVVGYLDHLLVVPMDEVTLDGSQCNKVGVSYSQFRTQQYACHGTFVGDCLHHQLFDKHISDLQKLLVNPYASTTYLLRIPGVFNILPHGAGSCRSATTCLEHRIEGMSSLRFEIELDAERVLLPEESLLKRDVRIIEAIVSPWDLPSSPAEPVNVSILVSVGNFGSADCEVEFTIDDCSWDGPSTTYQNRFMLLRHGEKQIVQSLISFNDPLDRPENVCVMLFDSESHSTLANYTLPLDVQDKHIFNPGGVGKKGFWSIWPTIDPYLALYSLREGDMIDEVAFLRLAFFDYDRAFGTRRYHMKMSQNVFDKYWTRSFPQAGDGLQYLIENHPSGGNVTLVNEASDFPSRMTLPTLWSNEDYSSPNNMHAGFLQNGLTSWKFLMSKYELDGDELIARELLNSSLTYSGESSGLFPNHLKHESGGFVIYESTECGGQAEATKSSLQCLGNSSTIEFIYGSGSCDPGMRDAALFKTPSSTAHLNCVPPENVPDRLEYAMQYTKIAPHNLATCTDDPPFEQYIQQGECIQLPEGSVLHDANPAQVLIRYYSSFDCSGSPWRTEVRQGNACEEVDPIGSGYSRIAGYDFLEVDLDPSKPLVFVVDSEEDDFCDALYGPGGRGQVRPIGSFSLFERDTCIGGKSLLWPEPVFNSSAGQYDFHYRAWCAGKLKGFRFDSISRGYQCGGDLDSILEAPSCLSLVHGVKRAVFACPISCFGLIEGQDLGICSGHGICEGIDQCLCFPGFLGSDCSTVDGGGGGGGGGRSDGALIGVAASLGTITGALGISLFVVIAIVVICLVCVPLCKQGGKLVEETFDEESGGPERESVDLIEVMIEEEIRQASESGLELSEVEVIEYVDENGVAVYEVSCFEQENGV